MKKSNLKFKICRISAIWLILCSIIISSCSPSAVRTGGKPTKKPTTQKQAKEISAEEKIKEFEKNITKSESENISKKTSVLPSLEQQLEILSNEQVSMKNQINSLQKDIEEIRYALDEIKNSLQKSNITPKKQVVAGIPPQTSESNQVESKAPTANVLLSDEEANKSFIQRNKKIENKTIETKSTGQRQATKSETIKTTSLNNPKRTQTAEPKQQDDGIHAEKTELTQALSLINQKQYDKAISEINDILSKTKSSAFKQEAIYWLAESHIQLGNYEQAIDLLTELNTNNNSEKAPEIAIKLAECKVKIGRIADAKNTYKQIIEKYPKSEQVPKARKMLQQM